MNTNQKLWLADFILSNTFENVLPIIKAVKDNVEFEVLTKIAEFGIAEGYRKEEGVVDTPKFKTEDIGVVGNVWVRVQYYPTINDKHDGHKHHHDHLSLLAKGSLRVKVEGCKPVIYNAPCFFSVKAEHHHELIPLEDDTIAYCIFALRNDKGEVVDDFDGNTSHYEMIKD